MPQPSKPLAVVVGFVAKLPVAGMAMYNFHYIAGLADLGYDVHYVERIKTADECYDPEVDAMGGHPTYGLQFMIGLMATLELANVRWTLIDWDGMHYGADRKELCRSLDRADFVLTLADPTWFEDLERCPRRAFVDGDPMFTQTRMLERQSVTSTALANYPTLFTYWMRQQAGDTTVPTAGRTWLSTTPVVATAMWTVSPARRGAPVTTLMNWTGTATVTYEGRSYGTKGEEFERMIDLPTRSTHTFSVAVGGNAPKDRLVSHGWTLENPLTVTRTLNDYRRFIAGSYADLGIAKNAYVASRSGWFSDRSLCYLASGRPVLHQDTGFADWLGAEKGVVAFSNVDEAVAGLRAFDDDYEAHSRAARVIAETRFEARVVVGRMLDDAGMR